MGNEGQAERPSIPEPGSAGRGRLESVIASIWSEMIDVEHVGLDDDFFALGGDSLAAVRMLAAVEDVLLAQVSFSDFLSEATVAALAGAIARSRAGHDPQGRRAQAPGVTNGRSPATFAQERLWFVDQLGGSNGAYNERRGARIRGRLNEDVLERGLQEVVRRHAALRTAFTVQDGRPVQVVAGQPDVKLERIDLRGRSDPEGELRRLTDEFASLAFDLERPPLLRAYLLRVADDEHVLQLVLHHIICDGWSHVVLLRELGAGYRALQDGGAAGLPDPRIQYPDYARDQRSSLRDQPLQDAVAPWLARLTGAPAALELPTDRPRPQLPSYRGATYRRPLAAPTTAAVRSFARATRVTPFAILLAAYYMLLSRHSGETDIVVGATTSGRDSPELADGVGLFASTVALRCDVSDQPRFAALVARVREVVMWAVAHENAPFDQIVAGLGRERDLSRHPVFQVFCAHVPHAPLELDGAVPFQARPTTSRFDLTLFLEEQPGDGVELAWEYSSDLFDAATIERLNRHYVQLLEAALTDPEMPVDELPLLDDREREEAEAAGNPSRGDYPVALMHELFEARAAEYPDAPALWFEGVSLSYEECNARANRLAHRLRALGAGPETLVALFLEPSPELVVAILGTLKSGAAYVPLDPEYPPERISFVLADSAAPLLVTDEKLRGRLPHSEPTIVSLDGDAAELAGQSTLDPEALAGPESLAYVIYTSGSTGKPKGVLVEHRQVARLFTATDEWFHFASTDTWILLHSYAFDFSVWELWGALAFGGRLVISPLWTTRSPQALAELVAEQNVTVLNATPSLFVTIQDELLRLANRCSLRFVVFGGEALAPDALRPWFDHHGDRGPTLVNMYGITETTVHVTFRPLRHADVQSGVSPIGAPIPDLGLYLLDARGRALPPGVAGELYVGGAGVARGYLNRPELTAERFIPNPFGAGRLYRTGDVAQRQPGGELVFRGRIDDQVKIRGFRIELGEIRTAILEVEGVSDTTVVALQAAADDLRLAAYVASALGSDGEVDLRAAVLAHLQHKLPSFMVPASLVVLDRIPLTRNGKTDKQALPPPTWEQPPTEDFLSPQTATETLIAEIWTEILGAEQVGTEDNFFNLGGHSLLAARVVTQIRKRLTIDLSVRALFEDPVLRGFAARVDRARPSAVEAEPVKRPSEAGGAGAGYPLSFTQQQLLFFDQLTPGSITYNAALAIRVQGPLDQSLLHAALQQVLARHETLHTVLVWDETAPRQVVLESCTAELELVDLVGLAPDARAAELARLMREHARRPFDLSTELMLRSTLFRLAAEDHVILFATHHVAFDAWAVEILYRDLGEIYDAGRRGRPAVLPELPLQYRDFAARQRERFRGEELQRELEFWRAQLAGAPTVLRLPTDGPRPAQQTFVGASREIVLDGGLADAVREVCRDHQATPYMLLLATFAALLYRWSGQDDILLGGPMANRDDPGYEHLIGFFANTIVVRVRMGGNPAFADLLTNVKQSVLASYDHQAVPLALVVDAVRPERDPGVNPLFQVNFRVRVGETPVLSLTDTTTSRVPVDLGLARFDLALELHLLDDALEAEFNYNTALFHDETIARLAHDFEALLRQVVADPGQRLLGLRIAADQSPAPHRSGRTGRSAGLRGGRPRRRRPSAEA